MKKNYKAPELLLLDTADIIAASLGVKDEGDKFGDTVEW